MALHDRIKEERLGKKMSQQELGDAFNITQQAVASWEAGKSVPDAITLDKLANFFGCTADYLLCRTDFRGIALLSSKDLYQNTKEAAKKLPLIMETYKTMDMNAEERAAYEYMLHMPKEELEAELQEIIDKLKNLPTEQRQALMTIINALPSSSK